MIFDTENNKKYEEWRKIHKCQFINPNSVCAIGGRLTFSFTPTSLGCISKVKCVCGEEIDTTNYSW